jgi:4-hydroxy-tetrahydrodipicolinate synthase
VIKGGVDFLVALGSTGEASSLSKEEKSEVLACILKACDNRMPVICGISGNNTNDVIQQLENADLRSFAAVMISTPYYVKPPQMGLYRHFKAIADSTNKQIIIYNVPSRTGCNIEPATVAKLAVDCKNITGIKEASGDVAQCIELMRLVPNSFNVLSGDDNLAISQLSLGLDGIISVAANCFTGEMTDMINLAMVNKFDKARKICNKLLPGFDLLALEGNPAGVKCMLHHMGICENILRTPLAPVSIATEEKIEQFVRSLQN